jgi:rhodanese-related sulfurtransferase
MMTRVSWKGMQQDELLMHIKKGLAPLIIDVRSRFEFRSGHISGAVHLPFWNVLFSAKLANYSKTQSIVLYCEHGPRAVLAKLLLCCRGFDEIRYLKGHMMAWKKSGLPVEKE